MAGVRPGATAVRLRRWDVHGVGAPRRRCGRRPGVARTGACLGTGLVRGLASGAWQDAHGQNARRVGRHAPPPRLGHRGGRRRRRRGRGGGNDRSHRRSRGRRAVLAPWHPQGGRSARLRRPADAVAAARGGRGAGAGACADAGRARAHSRGRCPVRDGRRGAGGRARRAGAASPGCAHGRACRDASSRGAHGAGYGWSPLAPCRPAARPARLAPDTAAREGRPPPRPARLGCRADADRARRRVHAPSAECSTPIGSCAEGRSGSGDHR